MNNLKVVFLFALALAVISVAQFQDMTQLMPLTLLPALTPWWAKKLNMIE